MRENQRMQPTIPKSSGSPLRDLISRRKYVSKLECFLIMGDTAPKGTFGIIWRGSRLSLLGSATGI